MRVPAPAGQRGEPERAPCAVPPGALCSPPPPPRHHAVPASPPGDTGVLHQSVWQTGGAWTPFLHGLRRTVGGNEVPSVVYELTQWWRHKTFIVFLKKLLLNYS